MHTSKKSRALWAGLVAAMLAGPAAHAQTNTLNTGKRINQPALGAVANVGSLPMNLVATPDGAFAVATDMGFRNALTVVDTTTGARVSQTAGTDKEPLGQPQPSLNNEFYYGLAFAPGANADGSFTLYASLGGVAGNGKNGTIGVYHLLNGVISQVATFTLTKTTDYAAGLATDAAGHLYVANSPTGAPSGSPTLTAPGSLIVLNAGTGAELGRFDFNTIPIPNGSQVASLPNEPYAVSALADGSRVYVSSQTDGTVYVLNASSPAAIQPVAALKTGSHPVSLLLSADQSTLYVANAHSETVSIVNTAANTFGSLDVRALLPAAARSLPGATPTGLGLSPDGGTLYVTLGDMNAVAVVNLAAGRLTGYIPTGWYPTAVLAGPYRHLLIADAKGTTTRNPNPEYTSEVKGYTVPRAAEYTEAILEGTVQTISAPNSVQLAQDTQQVIANNRLSSVGAAPAVFGQIGLAAGANAKIKHVIYIVKENRTYDQVLGDEPAGNGQPSLTIFGKSVTPNLHALAERFVLLDNFYDCAEVSGDGWPWSTQGQANEVVIKNVPQNYNHNNRNYDFEGTYNNYPVGGFKQTDLTPNAMGAYPVSPYLNVNGVAPPIPDSAAAPGGHIWDDVTRNGLSVRNYGFFYIQNADGVNLPTNFPAEPGIQPGGHDNAGKSDIDFRTYDNNYPDSDAPYFYAYGAFPANPGGPTPFTFPTTAPATGALYPTTKYGAYSAPSRYSEWYREYQEALNTNSVPNFTLLRLNHDHTQGFGGSHTPAAEVADDDFGVGQVVQAVSNGPQWDSTAIFVIEDDSQDGPDHVDCHRSICFVISPYVTQNSVDHTFYNTDSVLHTMELLLNIPPMSQYDAVATPILDFTAGNANNAPYTAILPAQSIVTQTMAALIKSDPAFKRLAMLSSKMDFTHPDSAPALLVNEMLWKSVKGFNSKMPAPRHTLTQAQLHFGIQPPARYTVKLVKTKAGTNKVVKTALTGGDSD